MVLSGSDSISFLFDRDWMIEAIENIVKNALDHTGKEDSIHIEWQHFASVVQITVKDTGSGIHPEDLHHIFKHLSNAGYPDLFTLLFSLFHYMNRR